VVEHVGLCIEHGVQCRFVSIEIGNEHFDFALRIQGTYLPNCLGPVGRAAIGQVVAVY
jgi:hypothetical protein